MYKTLFLVNFMLLIGAPGAFATSLIGRVVRTETRCSYLFKSRIDATDDLNKNVDSFLADVAGRGRVVLTVSLGTVDLIRTQESTPDVTWRACTTIKFYAP